MFEPVKIAPSILSADFMNMQRDICCIEDAGAGFIHVDVMDGHFVPNLSMGVPFVAALKQVARIPLDIHLMISNPLVQLPWYLPHLEAGDFVTLHYESFAQGSERIKDAIELIHHAQVNAGLALKPDTPTEVLAPYISELDMVLIMSVYPGFSGQSYIKGSDVRIAQVVQMAQAAGCSPLIEVDGGIGLANAGLVALAGADVLVCGNAVMKSESPADALVEIAQVAAHGQAQAPA